VQAFYVCSKIRGIVVSQGEAKNLKGKIRRKSQLRSFGGLKKK